VSDLKLFRIASGVATELTGASFALEKQLQRVIEDNMETLFAVRFVASEHHTGVLHAGRVDSLGLDENNSPVIFEYKRSIKENVINQGLFYLNWLLDHRGDFSELVRARLGGDAADAIDWTSPRLICVASDFDRYDEHAIAQINRSIELVRYRDFGGELLALDRVAATNEQLPSEAPAARSPRKPKMSSEKTVSDKLGQASAELTELYANLEAQLEALGDDVTKRTLKHYFAFRRLKNFACVEVHPQNQVLLVYLKVDPSSIALEEGFSRDVTAIGHFGTGNLELRVASAGDLERALPLLARSYEVS
jgi:predicted transport protein